MKLKQIMSSDVKFVAPETPVTRAAEIMRFSNVGCLPVVDAGEVVGVVTDRDIVLRGIGPDKHPRSIAIREIMTSNPHTLEQNANVAQAVTLMRHNRIRRIPVVDDSGALVGIVSLGDVALRAHEPIQSGTALACICARPAMVS